MKGIYKRFKGCIIFYFVYVLGGVFLFSKLLFLNYSFVFSFIFDIYIEYGIYFVLIVIIYLLFFSFICFSIIEKLC